MSMSDAETTRMWQRLVALEGADVAKTQKIFALEEKIRSYDNYFKNVKPPIDYTLVIKDLNMRIESLEKMIVHLENKSIWDFLKKLTPAK